MKVVYVGPIDAVEVQGQVFERGVAVDVPDELAGRAPSPAVAEVHAALAVAYAAGDLDSHRALTEMLAGLDHGEGLLAQNVWAAAPTKIKPASTTDQEAPK